MLGGCPGFADDTCDTDETGHRWCYGVSGALDAVADGTVFRRERYDGSTAEANYEVLALDAATGDQ